MQKKNLILKQQFGDLTINNAPSEINGKIVYSCKCSCGKTVSVNENDLKSGNITSCGCKMKKFINYPLNLTYFIDVENHKK